MSQDMQRDTLVHRFGSTRAEFCQQIDNTGGWPVGFKYVSFFHAVEPSGRVCIFGNRELHEPYWTTVLSSDDYYWWKLSDAKKHECVLTAKRQLATQLSRLEATP